LYRRAVWRTRNQNSIKKIRFEKREKEVIESGEGSSGNVSCTQREREQ
jgi:hypothetical protein